MGYIWIGCIITFAVIEMFTVQLVSIWFVLGSAVGLIAFLCGAGNTVQIAAAIAVSALSLILLRRFVYGVLKPKNTKTNVDALIGRELIVDESVNNLTGTGSGKVNGIVWSLRSGNGSDIPKGTRVVINEVKGVALMVSPVVNTEASVI